MKNPRILRGLIRISVTTAVLCFSVAWAQQPPKAPPTGSSGGPAQPLPPLPNGSSGDAVSGAIGGSAVQGDAQSASAQTQPDTHVLSGTQIPGLGSLHLLRHVVDPALNVSEFGETGILVGKTLSATEVGGSLGVDQHWKRYDLTFTYSGAETIYRPSYYGIRNLPYQSGAFSQTISFGRWTVLLRDDVLYSYGPGFGSLFAVGPAQSGQNPLLDSIQPSLASTGTIQTALARELSDTALGEIDYARSRRTTLTLAASYGLLDFLDSGYINSQNLTGRVGYNYALSAKNSFSLTYDHNRIIFLGSTSRLQTDLAQLAFGRKVTGRLAFQVSAGPQLIHSNYFGSAQSHQLSWSTSNSLTYQQHRIGYSLSYFRGVNAGSGVLFGSNTQIITGTANYDVTRLWSASMHGGYSINSGLVPTPAFAYRFHDWFTGANLNRKIGRQVTLGLTYGFQQQTTGSGACPVLSCGLVRPFSQYGISLQWHPLLGHSL